MVRHCGTTPQPLNLTANICKDTCTGESHLCISIQAQLSVHPILPPSLERWCRGRLLRSTCDFTAAQEDFEKLLELKPSHKGAAKELSLLQQGRQALEQAFASKCVPRICVSACVAQPQSCFIPDRPCPAIPMASQTKVVQHT